jgi:hypothetical protein
MENRAYCTKEYFLQKEVVMRRILAIGTGLVLVFSLGLGACKKKEQQPVPQAPQMPPAGQMPPGGQMPPMGQMPPAGQMPPGQGAGNVTVPKDLKIVVPDIVKGKWSAVKIIVDDKASKKKQEYTVNLNSEFKVPNSNLKIAVGDFIPDFKMNGDTITSASGDPNNPAVGVKVFDGGKQIFPAPGKKWGWLYSKFPMMHPFEHPQYGLFLKEGVKKG